MNRMTERRSSGIHTDVRFHLVHYQLVTLGWNNGEPHLSLAILAEGRQSRILEFSNDTHFRPRPGPLSACVANATALSRLEGSTPGRDDNHLLLLSDSAGVRRVLRA